MSIKKIHYIAGLPRTGTTLLSSILNQNPNFHSGPNSYVLNIMNMIDSVKNSEMHILNPNEKRINCIYNSIIYNYHRDEERPICFDKNRGWTGFIEKIKKYIDTNPKIICTTRDIKEVLTSFIMLLRKNNYRESNFIDKNLNKENINDDDRCLYLLGPGIVGESIVNLINGLKNHSENILLVDYDDLINNPKKSMEKIYDFLGEKYFEHDFNNIMRNYVEKDFEAYGIEYMHDIRNQLKKENYDYNEILSPYILNICDTHPVLHEYKYLCNHSKMEKRLYEIHNKLNFDKDELLIEIAEQLMIVKHLKPDSCVLELGGSIGRASCVINHILDNKEKHLVIEPNLDEAEKLKENRDNNSFKFLIETSAISKNKLYSFGNWHTFKTQFPGSFEVNIITLEDLKRKYQFNYNVLIIDSEGNFVDNLKDFPEILDGVELLQIEHDFHSQEDLILFYTIMEKNNFKMIDKLLKTDKFGPGMNWNDGIKTDPIFVSVWKR